MAVEYCEIKEKVIPRQPVYYVSALAIDVKVVDQFRYKDFRNLKDFGSLFFSNAVGSSTS